MKMLKKVVFKIIRILDFDVKFGHQFKNNKILKKLLFTPDFYSDNDEFVVTRGAVKFNVRPKDLSEWMILYGQTDDLVLSEIFELSKAKKTLIIFDIGANVGQFSIKASKMLPDAKIHSFEPNPTTYGRFIKNIQLNIDVNVNCHQYAVGKEEGSIEIQMPLRNSGAASLVRNYEAEKHEKHMVDVVSVDDFVKKENVVVVDFMKIDVENFEPFVLQGAYGVISKFHPTIYIEQGKNSSAGTGFPNDWVLNHLIENGYKLYLDNNDHFEPIDDLNKVLEISLINVLARFEKN